MDDNQNGDKNQQSSNPPIGVEEVAPTVESPENVQGSIPPEYPTDLPPVYEENRNQFVFISGIVVFFIVVLFLVYWFFLRGLLSGPGKEPKSPTNEKVTLVYWGLWDEKEVFQGLIDEYQSQNPNVTIQYEQVSPDTYRERLLARSKTGNGPDIFRYHNTWLPQLSEVITAIPPEIMTNEEFELTFYPIHAKDLKIENSYYGIPLMVDGLVMIYNEDILRQAGKQQPPQVWVGGQDDVINTVSALTVRDTTGRIITSGMAIGTANNIDHFGEIFGAILMLNGGDLKKLNEREAVEALQLYRKFGEENFWNESQSNSISAFIQGRVAMIFGPSWQVVNIKAQNPDLNVKVAQFPRGPDDKSISIANYWVEGVNKFGKNQIESWKFLKYLSQKEQLTKMYENQSKTRIFGVAYPRRDLLETQKDNQYLAPILDMAQNDRLISLPLVDRTFDKGMDDEILQYIENAINDTVNGVDYGEALNKAQQGVSQVFERYKIK
ncbi:hypothetical protein A3A93_00810 [Candidatus Roizmanbacteria bacterium RIFCSPLOWO2_01_FULL_38_12]|uniref:ABC transporter substrate-binding protein n=1 Tax=Candidatus Roizmanbacteria bacterium RIFCSPLOWO2_01_FULL_38_12 TaxID=1802061 RepID=A0A1F7IVL5_9BACT|nr:MAG: hypothetical protein A2861_04320 [Candidatus Roizmanbacteria bacterium RIFCSPHIGHO2_01_FULL_38_15]OGK34795.1 MAG: hypothetical protein A3F59_05925 [Candidatus Roizmanbacteria bacterium RIFCSPHIGHO2_12_FULL_38_13]OGK47401.1 MAG: hypothetical protein A3A93_00810 [Candidatus Roizmanbacteria bacterium RIFCSPLOWO2_01_FULL_38_12]